MKIIQILTHSLSPLQHYPTPRHLLTSGWHATLSTEIMKHSPSNLQVECWRPELSVKKTYMLRERGMVYRIFPSFGIMGREISFPLLGALNTEVSHGSLVIHLHGVFTWLTYIVVALFGGRVPIIVQHHGEEPAMEMFSKMIKDRSLKSLGYLLLSMLEQLAIPLLKKADFFFALNRRMKAYLGSVVGDQKVAIGTMGIDFDKFTSGDSAVARKRLELSDDKKYILYVGSLLRIKGLEDLIHAFHSILKTYPQSCLLLVGLGNDRDRLQSLCRTLGIMENVLFVGWVGNDRLPDFYNVSDVCVLPSLREGLGLTAVEALACGRPFVGSDVGGIPEVVKKFRAGFLVSPQDRKALADALLRSLSSDSPPQTGRREAEKCYDWKYVVANNIQIYHSLVKRHYGANRNTPDRSRSAPRIN